MFHAEICKSVIRNKMAVVYAVVNRLYTWNM